MQACPVNKLTSERLAKAFQDLAGPELQTAAAALQKEMLRENGIEGGLLHFLDCLPRENMLCDVSLLLGETEIARYELIGTQIPTHGIKVSPEVAAFLEAEDYFLWSWKSICRRLPSLKNRSDSQIYAHGIRRHSICTYNLAGQIHTFHHGIIAAFSGLVRSFFAAFMQLYYKPDKYARISGAFGCLYGLLVANFYVALELLLGGVVVVDRIGIAFTNGIFGQNYDYIVDSRRQARVYDSPVIAEEKARFLKHGIPRTRRKQLRRAMEDVANARRVFQTCGPFFPKGHKHFLVVSLPKLEAAVTSADGKVTLGLTDIEATEVAERLHSNSLPQLSSVRRYSALGNPFVAGASTSSALENAKGMIISLVSKVNPFARRQPDETEISFSHFIQALQKVFAKRSTQMRREQHPTSTSVRLQREGFQREFSEFLN
jgi:hypothetical protein